VSALTEELRGRSALPPHVLKVLEAMPDNAHPMTQLTQAIMAMQTDSKFAAAYAGGGSPALPLVALGPEGRRRR
jgi:citrate synthase